MARDIELISIKRILGAIEAVPMGTDDTHGMNLVLAALETPREELVLASRAIALIDRELSKHGEAGAEAVRKYVLERTQHRLLEYQAEAESAAEKLDESPAA